MKLLVEYNIGVNINEKRGKIFGYQLSFFF